MPLSDANKRNLRLPRELAGRLKAEAGAQGISENDYLILAATQKLDADEARRQQQRGEVPRHKTSQAAPRGLGIRLRPALEPPPPPPVLEPAPVVVHVGGPLVAAPAAGGDLITALVQFVRSGAVFERERRRRQALEILRPHADRDSLERQLHQALADKPEPGPNRLGAVRTSHSSIGSLFR